MALIRVQEGELDVGAEVPWAVVDRENRLLLQRGAVISSQRQLESLQMRGMYRNDGTRPIGARRLPNEDASAFDHLDEVIRRTGAMLVELAGARPGAVEEAEDLARTLIALYERWPDALLGAVHLCHEQEYVHCHPVHCAILAQMLARALDFDAERCVSLIAAALTQNVAIVPLQRQLVNQRAPLDEMQREEIRQHPQRGVEILLAAGVRNPLWLQAVQQHHEQHDGSGYPAGMRGSAISEESRILHLADVYGAMISGRSYRSGLSPGVALKRFYVDRRGRDETLRHLFIRELGVYPPGELVQLNTGELGIVVKRGASGITPLVSAYQTPRGATYPQPAARDCAAADFEIRRRAAPRAGIQLSLPVIWSVVWPEFRFT